MQKSIYFTLSILSFLTCFSTEESGKTARLKRIMLVCHWKMKREVSIRILRKHIWMRWQLLRNTNLLPKAVAA